MKYYQHLIWLYLQPILFIPFLFLYYIGVGILDAAGQIVEDWHAHFAAIRLYRMVGRPPK